MSFVLRRLWQMLPTMLGVVLLVFLLFNWVGGDPAYILAGKISNPEQIANIRRQLGIDQPYWVQLWIFIQQIVSFDFGTSWSTNEPVSQILATRLGPSLTLLIPLQIIEIIISMKWQQVGGTAEQKVPFEVMCLADCVRNLRAARAYLVLGGDGWTLRDYFTSCALAEHLIHAGLVRVVTLEAFVRLANRGEL